MAKAKSKLANVIQNPLAKPTRYAGVTKATDLTFYDRNGEINIRTKPHSPKPPTQAQREQHQLWKDADCMWRFMSPGQRRRWTDYYRQEQQAGRTLSNPQRPGSPKLDPIPPKDMGQLSFFMSHALQWDLLTYLQNHLSAHWHNYTLEITETSFTVQMGLLTPPMVEAWIAMHERQPVMGRF